MDGVTGAGVLRLVDFCGEEWGGVEGGFFAAQATEIELVAAHGHADAAFDAGGHLGEEVGAALGGEHGAAMEIGHFGVLELVKGKFDGKDVGFDFGDLFEGAG